MPITPHCHLVSSISLPVTLITMKTMSSSPVITRVSPNNRCNFNSISSCNNLGFQKLITNVQHEPLQLSIKQRSEIRAAKSLMEDESGLSDWVNGLTRKNMYNVNDDDRRNSYRGGGRGGGGGGRGRGRGGSGMNRRNDNDNRGSFGGSSRGGGSRGSFGDSRGSFGGSRGSFGSSSRGGGSRGSFGGGSRGRGRFGGEFGGRGTSDVMERGRFGGEFEGRGSRDSNERGRFGGEFEGRNEGFRKFRESGFENGRGGRGSSGLTGRGRRKDGGSRESDRGKGSWGSYYSTPEGREPYVRDDLDRDDDRFVSNRRDDRFVGGGGGGGRGRGRGGVRTSVSRSMEGGRVMTVNEDDLNDDDDDEAKLMYNYREVISDEEGSDDFEDDGDDDVVLEKSDSMPSLPRISTDGNESYLSETRFDECSVSPLSLRAIKDAGYEKMTIVQEATLPVILEGKDVLAKARTGTGKTVAFLLPSIEVVVNSPPVDRNQRWPPVVVLVICPTRELASQAAMEANKLLKYHPSIGVQVVIGGTRIATEQRRLQTNPCQILIATPGRLKDHIMNTSGFATQVKGVKVLVLDEADHLLDMGFRKDIENIIAAVPKQRQTLLFSATVPPEVRQICHIALKRDHEYINTVEEGSEETHTQVQQKYLIAPLDRHFPLLYTLLKDHIAEDADYKVLVFCTTAMVTKLVADLLGQLKLNIREIHSRKSQSNRTQVSDEFRRSKGLILVTSDVSARGVDYPDVTLVIQVGLPSDKAQYIHRLGRTGRKGKEGEGILLLAPWEEFFLSSVRDLPISKADPPLINPDTNKKVERALSYIDMKLKESAYQAWLGYYNSNKTVAKDKQRLVELANEFSRSMGLDIPPALSKIVLGKMGLKNVPGLRFK
ncbi:DEAD-box ATP-dependent RNA helicase 31-like [Rutidosis leptorrhynchoides]|uniref:DEAD-box ATP-dependent RNA helicase 31-like n=1 Tax=Rutidosis leptorrhynchoides TaxID=125765 RepID=UPI003A9952CC